MPGDEIVQELLVPVPKGGFADGLDPALGENDYPASLSPDMLNIRVGFGRWETRLGMTLFKTMPGTGVVRLLDNMSLADGTRIRLLARGDTTAGILYDYEVGTDTSFQALSGGTGLGSASQPYFQGVSLNDFYYFTDRSGALKRYSTASVTTVAQPAQPGAAPGVRARPYANLESWNGGGGTAPFGWTRTNSGRFDITDDSGTYPSPIGGRTVKLNILSSSAAGEDIHENVTGETLNSDTVCYWLRQERNRFHQEFEIGINAAGDLLQQHDRDATPNEWYPIFMNVRGIGTINYKRFRVMNATIKADWVTKLVLPGRLSGEYRWFYTHYDPATGRESKPSAVSNSNAPLDFSIEGISYKTATAAAINKSAVLNFTSDSGTDATTTKIRIYRNGGTAELTLDDAGHEVWYRVGEVYDQSTTLSAGPSAADTTISVTAATNLAAGDTLVIDKGTSAEEYVTIAVGGISGTTLTLTEPLVSAHVNGHAVQVAFLDNVANETVDTLTPPIQKERDDPPSGSFWVARSPDGRLWLFGPNTHVAVSNKSTPDKPTDYEVFPNNVDPLTRRDLLQGFRFEVGGDTTDEVIQWGGFFNGVATVLTRRHLYQVYAYGQADWGPNAVQKVHAVGCLNGDTVAEVNGVLYWVADGPRVMRWDGRGAPECVSHERVNQTLSDAPSGYWNLWLGRYHARLTGKYYRLFLTPSGATTNTLALDLNVENGAWEPCAYNDSAAARLSFRGAVVLDGGSDALEMYQAASDGSVYQVESGTTDNTYPIAIRFSTKKFPLGGFLGMLHTLLFRLAAVTDTVTVTLTAGGGEYGTKTAAYSHSLSGTGDLEKYQRLDRTLAGRWAQVTVAGSVSNRPAFREFVLRWLPLRSSRYRR